MPGTLRIYQSLRYIRILKIVWNPKVHCSVHTPLVPILNQIIAVHTTLSLFFKIRFNIIPHLRLVLPSGIFFFWLSEEKPVWVPVLSCSCCIPCSSHPPGLDHYLEKYRKNKPKVEREIINN
jgi:hypothetical protein